MTKPPAINTSRREFASCRGKRVRKDNGSDFLSVLTRRSTCAVRQTATCLQRGPTPVCPSLDYPLHDKTVTVTACGRICFNRQKSNLSTVFAGQKVGIKQVSEEGLLERPACTSDRGSRVGCVAS
jgi:3-methyladenine DNA glycosylase Mpg